MYQKKCLFFLIISNCIIVEEANNFKLCVHSTLHYKQMSYFVLG